MKKKKGTKFLSIEREEGALMAKSSPPTDGIEKEIEEAAALAQRILEKHGVSGEGPPLKKWMAERQLEGPDDLPLEILSALMINSLIPEILAFSRDSGPREQFALHAAVGLGRAREALDIHLAHGKRIEVKKSAEKNIENRNTRLKVLPEERRAVESKNRELLLQLPQPAPRFREIARVLNSSYDRVRYVIDGPRRTTKLAHARVRAK